MSENLTRTPLETLLQVFDETVAFYDANPDKRGYSDTGGCEYVAYDRDEKDNLLPGTERCCAVGRMLTDEERRTVHQQGMNGASVRTLIDRVSVPSLRPYPVRFLEKMQALHDGYQYWDATGLSPLGVVRRDAIRQEIIDLYEKNRL
jgi:hypothetical protein